MSVRPVTRATAALIEYLGNADHGLNVALAAIRTDDALTTALLPNAAAIIDWTQQRERNIAYPAVEIQPVSVGRDEEANQRLYPVRLAVTATIPSNTVQGPVDDLIAAGWRYVDAVVSCLQRRTPKGEQGNTLANGGAGAGAGRIVRATVETGRVLVDDEQIGRVYAAVEIVVTVAEDY